MTYQKFLEEFIQKIRERIGEEEEVSVHSVTKNNGVVLQGITLVKKEGQISPLLYAEDYWKMYQKGMPVERLAEHFLSFCEKECFQKDVDLSFFREFDKVKERIYYKLINRERNEELLKDVPHIPFLDLAICFYYSVAEPSLMPATILIRNQHTEMWGCTTRELFALAAENTPRNLPISISNMWNVLQEMGMESVQEESELAKEHPLYIVTNREKNLGAIALLYPGELENMAKSLGGSYYVLPSSIHELLVFPDGGESGKESLRQMITDINRTAVEREDVLSDYPYYYDSRKGVFSRICEKQSVG